ncbi:MAG TPA: ATP-binding protein, partial [Allosphingosinicella sp.]|nr:ATP-binding protein [Allosphingosinicella sp.]
MVEIEVADTGAGIAAEHLESLFSEFMTTKSGGMGLGLPISRTIVEAHGGEIRAENRQGGGAAFIFTLPRARRRTLKPQKAPRL